MCYCLCFGIVNTIWVVVWERTKKDLWCNDLWNEWQGSRLKFVSSLDVLLSGWLDSKHQLTNQLTLPICSSVCFAFSPIPALYHHTYCYTVCNTHSTLSNMLHCLQHLLYTIIHTVILSATTILHHQTSYTVCNTYCTPSHILLHCLQHILYTITHIVTLSATPPLSH